MQRKKRPLSKRQVRKQAAGGFVPIMGKRHPHGNRWARRRAMSIKGGDNWRRNQEAWGQREARRRMKKLGRVTLRTLSVVDPKAVLLNYHGKIPLPPPGSNVVIGAHKIPLAAYPLAKEKALARAKYTPPNHTGKYARSQARG